MARYTREHWTDAALAAMAEGGTVAINMEQLARRLGASKGAVYYHFENRQAMLEAALERWEETVAADFRAGAGIEDPRERLTAFTFIATGTGLDGFVDIALASSMHDPTVAETVERVNELRLSALMDILAELEVSEDEIRERALGGLATYLGLYQLQRSTGQRFDEALIRRLLTKAIDAMLG